MTVFELLNIRYQWEQLAIEFKLNSDKKHGSIDNLKWFLLNGHTGNRFKSGYKEAVNIAQTIVNEYVKSMEVPDRGLEG